MSAIPRNRGRRKRKFKGMSTMGFLENTKINSKRDRCEILRRALFVLNTRSKIGRNKNCKVFPFPDSTPVIYFETVAHNVGFSSSPVFRDPSVMSREFALAVKLRQVYVQCCTSCLLPKIHVRR